MMQQLKLLSSTAVLTGLIWVYADQSLQTSEQISASIQIAAEPGTDLVPILVSPGPRGPSKDTFRAQLEFEGSRRALRMLNDRAQSEQGLRLRYFLLEDTPLGRQTISLVDKVSGLPPIRESGVRVRSAEPPEVTVNVDRYVREQVIVKADPGKLADALEGKPIIAPAVVTVRLLGSERRALGETLPPVRLPIEEVLAGQEGTVGPVPVALPTTWYDLQVAFQPPRVNVTATVKGSFVRKPLKLTVGVLALNPDMLGGYEVRWVDDADRFWTVEFGVPAEKADIFDDKDVRAYVFVSSDDLAAATSIGEPAEAHLESPIEREVHFDFIGDEFEDVRVEGAPPRVRFWLVPTSTTPPVGVVPR